MTTLRKIARHHTQKPSVVGVLSGFVALLTTFLLFLSGCGPSVPKVEIGKNYDFSQNHSIGIYVRPSGRDSLDRSFSAVAALDFISLGYNVVDCNEVLHEHADSLGDWHGAIAARDSLLHRSYMPPISAIAIWTPAWDSALLVTYYNERAMARSTFATWGGYKVLRLYSGFDMFDALTGARALSSEDLDSTRLYRLPSEDNPSRGEFPWQLAARQMNRQLASIPVCAVSDTLPPKDIFPVVFDVDKDYRTQFPKDWKLRLQRRLLYANDLFRRQFNIGFELRGYVESDAQFDQTLDNTLSNLRKTTRENDSALHIGITVDQALTWNWRMRSRLGLAYGLFPEMMITAQPSLPGLGAWSSLEEALTLVHELGHVFGAGHASSDASVMYPTSGSMAFLFDKLNENIIDSMKNNFFSESRKEKNEHYLQVLSSLRKSPECMNSAAILGEAAGAAEYLLWERNPVRRQVFRVQWTDSAGAALTINDPALKDAIDGYAQYKALNYDKAAAYFAKAVDEDPEFGEARTYYYLALRKIGKSKEAGEQLDKANQMHMAWVMEER
jgi:tetratricopeptide (TPR) repeat protein